MYIEKVTTYKRGEHEQSTDGGETTTVGGETSCEGAKRPGGETSKGQNVHKPHEQKGQTPAALNLG